MRRAYDLTIDRREAAALEQILSRCASVGMEPPACSTGPAVERAESLTSGDALARYDDNDNGRITCKEARRHGIAPVRWDHPAYPFMRDADSDGIVCE